MNDSVTPTTWEQSAEQGPVGRGAGGRAAPLVFKGASYTLTSIRLNTTDLAAIALDLSAKVAQAPAFFRDAPMVIDLEDVERRPLDMTGLLKTLRTHGLLPIGVRGGSERQREAGRAAGLPLLRGTHYQQSGTGEDKTGTKGQAASKPAVEAPVESASAAAESPPRTPAAVSPASSAEAVAAEPERSAPPAPREGARTRLVTQPVRSGQQVYAAGADLIVLGAVNAGSEILADGNIHVYAPLRGRVLAGVKGNRDVRIFALSMEAELVSIAGTYQMFDEDSSAGLRGRPVQIYLEGETLKIEPIV